MRASSFLARPLVIPEEISGPPQSQGLARHLTAHHAWGSSPAPFTTPSRAGAAHSGGGTPPAPPGALGSALPLTPAGPEQAR